MAPTVVVVDDHVSFRAMACRMLAAAGFEVVGEAGDVGTAIDTVRRHRPDRLLLDVLLPDGTAIDVLAALDREGIAARALLTSSRSPIELPASVDEMDFIAKGGLTLDALIRWLHDG